MNVALIGSVSSSFFTLDALIRSGVEVACVCGVDESRAEQIGDYHSLRELAGQAAIPFLSFVKVGEPEVEAFLREHKPDMLWVIGLSQLVPQRLIDIAPGGGVGFHPTMLPKGRGRAPVAWTILLGEPAAANLFYLTDEPDAGDIIIQREVPVGPDDYSEDLIRRTNEVLAEAIFEVAGNIKTGVLPRTPQDQSRASYYDKRTPADGLIDWNATTDRIYRLVRAAGRPYQGAFSHIGGAKVVAWRATPAAPEDALSSAQPGLIVRTDAEKGTLVKTGDGGLWLTEVVVEHAQEVDDQDLLRVGRMFKETA